MHNDANGNMNTEAGVEIDENLSQRIYRSWKEIQPLTHVRIVVTVPVMLPTSYDGKYPTSR